MKWPVNTKVRIIKGRLEGETGTVMGERTGANWNHMVHVHRDNPKAYNKRVQFPCSWLEKID